MIVKHVSCSVLSKLQASLVGRKHKSKAKTTFLSHAHRPAASHNNHISLTESSILLRSRGWECIFFFNLCYIVKGATVDFRLLSWYSNSWSPIDLKLFYQIVIKAIGNGKEATTALLPIHKLRYVLSGEDTSSLSLKRQLPLFRTSLPDSPALRNDSPLSILLGTLNENLPLILQK